MLKLLYLTPECKLCSVTERQLLHWWPVPCRALRCTHPTGNFGLCGPIVKILTSLLPVKGLCMVLFHCSIIPPKENILCKSFKMAAGSSLLVAKVSADVTGSLFSLGWTHRDVSSHVLSAQCELGMSNVALVYMVTSEASHIIIFLKRIYAK